MLSAGTVSRRATAQVAIILNVCSNAQPTRCRVQQRECRGRLTDYRRSRQRGKRTHLPTIVGRFCSACHRHARRPPLIRAAYVFWDEFGSSGSDVVRRTAADLNAASVLGSDDAVSPGAGGLSRLRRLTPAARGERE